MTTNDSRSEGMTAEEGRDFLQSLLNKNLRVVTTDSRLFWGSFKCTDPESNIVLQHTYEYRHPSPTAVAQTAATSSTSQEPTGDDSGTVKVDMISRYLGLVVIPGKHIVTIEVEEFASQMKGSSRFSKLGLGPGVTTTTATTMYSEGVV